MLRSIKLWKVIEMKSRLILSALFKLRNIGILLLMLGISALLNNSLDALPLTRVLPLSDAGLVTYPLSFIIYLVFVLKTINDKEFH